MRSQYGLDATHTLIPLLQLWVHSRVWVWCEFDVYSVNVYISLVRTDAEEECCMGMIDETELAKCTEEREGGESW